MRLRASVWVSLVAFTALLGCHQPGPTVLIVGLDGADWDVLDPLIEEGHVPALAAVVEGGARADFDCRPAWPEFSCFCPPVWVSISTGRPAAEHGIFQLGQPSTERLARTIWQVYGEAGGTSVVSSYRNTNPPEIEGNAFVFTEVGNSRAGQVNYRTWGHPEPPEDAGAIGRPGKIYEWLGLLPFTRERLDLYPVIAKDRVGMEALRRTARLGRIFERLTGRPGLYVITIHSIDKAEHATWATIQPAPGDPIDRARILERADAWAGPVFGPAPFAFGNVVSQYLEADRWLGRLLASVPFDYVLLVSDHGMTRRVGPGLAGGHATGETDAHQGIFAMRGPGIAPGVRLEDVDVLDVAPTVAHLLALAVADDLPGRVLDEAFDPEWLDAHPVQTVSSWETPPGDEAPSL